MFCIIIRPCWFIKLVQRNGTSQQMNFPLYKLYKAYSLHCSLPEKIPFTVCTCAVMMWLQCPGTNKIYIYIYIYIYIEKEGSPFHSLELFSISGGAWKRWFCGVNYEIYLCPFFLCYRMEDGFSHLQICVLRTSKFPKAINSWLSMCAIIMSSIISMAAL